MIDQIQQELERAEAWAKNFVADAIRVSHVAKRYPTAGMVALAQLRITSAKLAVEDAQKAQRGAALLGRILAQEEGGLS